jgi:hypothetical protein
VIAVSGPLVVTLSKPETEPQQEQHQSQPAKQDGAANPQTMKMPRHKPNAGPTIISSTTIGNDLSATSDIQAIALASAVDARNQR